MQKLAIFHIIMFRHLNVTMPIPQSNFDCDIVSSSVVSGFARTNSHLNKHIILRSGSHARSFLVLFFATSRRSSSCSVSGSWKTGFLIGWETKNCSDILVAKKLVTKNIDWLNWRGTRVSAIDIQWMLVIHSSWTLHHGFLSAPIFKTWQFNGLKLTWYYPQGEET